MTIGIYIIQHRESGKCYVGKSIDVERRFIEHKCYLKKNKRNKKVTNRYLYNAVQKYGWYSFKTFIVEKFKNINEQLIAERELFWMDFYDSCNTGYNLRRDSSTGMIVHENTRLLQKELQCGKSNNNYGYRWTKEMKDRMSRIKKSQHENNKIYDDEWRSKISKKSKSFWKNNPEKKKEMARKVSEKKKKYKFKQLNEAGELLKEWDSIEDIISANPTWKWQNIYSVCNGYKKRIYGFKWVKVKR